jgi:hypothetical protein
VTEADQRPVEVGWSDPVLEEVACRLPRPSELGGKLFAGRLPQACVRAPTCFLAVFVLVYNAERRTAAIDLKSAPAPAGKIT